jgi:hypothetical protein
MKGFWIEPCKGVGGRIKKLPEPGVRSRAQASWWSPSRPVEGTGRWYYKVVGGRVKEDW